MRSSCERFGCLVEIYNGNKSDHSDLMNASLKVPNDNLASRFLRVKAIKTARRADLADLMLI